MDALSAAEEGLSAVSAISASAPPLLLLPAVRLPLLLGALPRAEPGSVVLSASEKELLAAAPPSSDSPPLPPPVRLLLRLGAAMPAGPGVGRSLLFLGDHRVPRGASSWKRAVERSRRMTSTAERV